MSPMGARSWACGAPRRHQKAGSRMAGSLMKLQLHQIRIERCKRSVESATERLDHRMSGVGDPRAGVGIVQPRGEMRDKTVGAGNRLRTVGVVKCSVAFSTLTEGRARQNRGAELGGFDRVLPAVLDERAADEDCGCHTVEESEVTARDSGINLTIG